MHAPNKQKYKQERNNNFFDSTKIKEITYLIKYTNNQILSDEQEVGVDTEEVTQEEVTQQSCQEKPACVATHFQSAQGNKRVIHNFIFLSTGQ